MTSRITDRSVSLIGVRKKKELPKKITEIYWLSIVIVTLIIFDALNRINNFTKNNLLE